VLRKDRFLPIEALGLRDAGLDERTQARHTSSSPALCGGDVDAQWKLADALGDETVCGSNATPDQNVVDEYAGAMGLTYEPNEELWCGDKERERDRHRWELDPASAEDYDERMAHHFESPALPWRHFSK
jgi:hypothetical protein